jgi:hypothetical protein
MTTVKQIEQALEHLPPDQLAEFRSWFAEFDASKWDAQIEKDAMTGKLDLLADEALRDFRSNRCKPL